jgi:hypothetical protein
MALPTTRWYRARVRIVWEPQWTSARLDPAAARALGLR